MLLLSTDKFGAVDEWTSFPLNISPRAGFSGLRAPLSRRLGGSFLSLLRNEDIVAFELEENDDSSAILMCGFFYLSLIYLYYSV